MSHTFSRILDKSIGFVFFVIAFFVPLFFLPFTPEQFEFNKQALVILGASILLLLWTVLAYRAQEFSFSRSRVHLFALLAVLLTIPSAFYSVDKFTSIFGFGATSSAALLTTIAFFVLYLVGSSSFSLSRSLMLLRAILASSFVAVIASFFSFSGILQKGLLLLGLDNVLVGNVFTPLGSVNGLRVFLATAIVLGIGGAMAWKGSWRIFAIISTVLSLLFGMIIFSSATWIVLFLVMAILVLVIFVRLRANRRGLTVVLPAVVIGLALVFLFMPPALPSFSIPVEVSPSYSSSISIDQSALSEKLLIGFGQGQWQYAYTRFFPVELNQTSYWNSRFIFGSSQLTTMPAEVGVLGFVSWILFLIFVAVTGFRRLLRMKREALMVVLPAFLAWSALVISSFLFVGSMTAGTLFWLITTVLVAVGMTGFGGDKHTDSHGASGEDAAAADATQENDSGGDEPRLRLSAWRVAFDRGSFVGQVWLLLFVFAFVAVLGVGFFFTERYRASASAVLGTRALSEGRGDDALSGFVNAVRLEKNNSFYWRALSEASLSVLLSEISTMQSGDSNIGEENLQQVQAQRIQALATDAVTSANRATQLVQVYPQSWAQRARVFSALLPYGWEGAADELLLSWERAAELDPKNPFYLTELGKARILIYSQLREDENKRLELIRRAEDDFRAALELKGDYAPAHYQLAVLASISGDQEETITRTEAAVVSAPEDSGLRFQLGLLYMNAERINDAEIQFLNAIALNPQYANARYFLGLVLDGQGRKEEAIAQFEWLIERNPELVFLQGILANIREGSDALSGIGATQKEGGVPEPLPEELSDTVLPELGL